MYFNWNRVMNNNCLVTTSKKNEHQKKILISFNTNNRSKINCNINMFHV